MPRFTSQGWWCHCTQKNSPESRICSKCKSLRYPKNANVHASERAVVYVNPATGERRTPPRADMAMPEVYQRQGFERVEIESMVKYEKETGVVHEATSYNPGNEPTSSDPRNTFKPDPKVVHELALDIAAAAASGPWTGADKLL